MPCSGLMHMSPEEKLLVLAAALPGASTQPAHWLGGKRRRRSALGTKTMTAKNMPDAPNRAVLGGGKLSAVALCGQDYGPRQLFEVEACVVHQAKLVRRLRQDIAQTPRQLRGAHLARVNDIGYGSTSMPQCLVRNIQASL